MLQPSFFRHAVYVHCLCSHDIDHPGHGAAFEVQAQSPLAQRHNDTSVLEAHHSHLTFVLLKNEELNIFSNLSREESMYCRKMIIKCILGTDMAKHASLVKRLCSRCDSGCQGDCSTNDLENYTRQQLLDVENERDRFDLAEITVHAADLSAQIGPFQLAKEWGKRLSQEFRQEAKLHEEAGLSAPAFMTSINSDYDLFQIQCSFIRKIVLPLWEALNKVVGNLGDPVARLQDNLQMYEKRLKEMEKGD